MTTDLITALGISIPAIIGAIIALIQAVRANRAASIAAGIAVHAAQAINSHVVVDHNAFPIQPPSSQEPPLQ